ncbi:MAG: hypothetical protein CMP48_05025 [Rickettsiales bacterium]|nr:hypothetical protein [Rickettsiales bacterium]
MLTKRSIQLVFSILLFGSCQQIIEVEDIEFKEQLVLNCVMGTNERDFGSAYSRVELTSNRDILDSAQDYKGITEAEVLLYENNSLLGIGRESLNGRYYFWTNPKAGNNYIISVKAEGYDPIEAEQTIPRSLNNAEIKQITPEPIPNLNEEHRYRLTYTIDDPPGLNFYDLDLKVRYSYGASGQTDYNVDFWEVGVNLDAFNENDTSRVFSDELFDGQLHTRTIEFDYVNEDNFQSDHIDIILNLRHVSEAYYLYYTSLERQAESHRNPFAEPALAYTNVVNGFGAFLTYSSNPASYRVK